MYAHRLSEANIEALVHCCPALLAAYDAGFVDDPGVFKANVSSLSWEVHVALLLLSYCEYNKPNQETLYKLPR